LKTTLGTKELREAVNSCAISVAKRATVPSTRNILFEVQGQKMVVKATDLQDGIITSIPCESFENLAVSIYSPTIRQYVCNGDGKVVMDLDGRKCSLERSGLGKLEVLAGKPEDFPLIPYDPSINWCTLDARLFCKMLTILLNGCATDESRPVLTAIALHDGRMASADGFRLYSVKDAGLNFGLDDKEALVYKSTAVKAVRLFGKKENLEIGFSYDANIPKRVYFRSGETVLVGQLVQGKYPRYEQLIPQTFQSRVSFSVPLMLERLKMIDPMVISSGIIRLEFIQTKVEEPICLLTAGNPNVLEGDEARYELSLPIKNHTEEYGKIAMALKYLAPAIQYFSMCDMELTSPSSPMKFTGDLEWLTVVVMPMYVTWE
jgi:DNA polymerase III subunit beta